MPIVENFFVERNVLRDDRLRRVSLDGDLSAALAEGDALVLVI
jgi:hypothetical protein